MVFATVMTNVIWMLYNRWNTCLNYYGKINYRISHIFSKENTCADKLVNSYFIHRVFSLIYRLSFSVFLEFFINIYRLCINYLCTNETNHYN